MLVGASNSWLIDLLGVRSDHRVFPLISDSAVCRQRRQIVHAVIWRDRGAAAALRYARRDRSKNRGPRVSRLASEPPSPRCAVPGKGACAGPLCLPCPSTVQCFGRGIAGAGRAGLSAVQLPALCGAGADLQPLRSRQIYCAGECAQIRRQESPVEPQRATNAAAVGRTAMPPGSGGGGCVGSKK